MFLLCFFLLLLGTNFSPLLASNTLTNLLKPQAPENLFVSATDEKRTLLRTALDALSKLEKDEPDVVKKISVAIESTNNHIDALEEELSVNKNNVILSKSLSFLKETVLTLKEMLQVRGNLRILLQEFIRYLRIYLDDAEFESFKREYTAKERSYYTFEDEYKVYNQIIGQEALIAQLAEQEKNLQTEKSNRKAATQASQEEHTRALNELESLFVASSTHSLDKKRVEEAIRYLDQLSAARKEWEELRTTEMKQRITFSQTKTFVEKMRLDTMQKMFRLIKNSIRIGEIDVIAEKESVAQIKKEYLAKKETYQEERNKLLTSLKEQELLLEHLCKEEGISLGKEIDDWSSDTRHTIGSYAGVTRISTLNAHISLIKKEIERLQALIALEDEKFNFANVQLKAKESYYRMIEHKFFSEENITQELDSYKLQKTECLGTIAQLKEKMNAVAEQLGQQKKVLDNIHAWEELISRQKNGIFKQNAELLTQLLSLTEQAHLDVQKKIDILGQLTAAYSGSIAETTNTIRLIDFIVSELQSKTMWYRPEYAITLHGIQSIVTDLSLFFVDAYSHATRFESKTLVKRVKELIHNRFSFIFFLSKLFLLLFIFFLIRQYASFLARFFLGFGKKYTGFIRYLSTIIALFCQFTSRNFGAIHFWIFLLFLLYQFAPDTYSFVFFYLFSIPYLSYLTYRFTKAFLQFNVQSDYALLSADFQNRFIILMATLAHATIIIFFLRQAFILASHYHSELPTILLAINFIIFQISLIFLISKEQIISIIPSKNVGWLWIRTQVETYFYLILLIAITIIILSNPYIGFGQLVLYMLSNIFYTVVLFKFLIWIHGKVKKTSSYIFFFSGEDIIRERFSHARTWFGLLIITSFLMLSFLGIMVGAKIWGWPIAIKDFVTLLNKPIILEQTTTPISLASLLEIIGFVLGGFIAAYAINRFVLDKIFDLLLIDSGVQHATVRLIQYFLVLITIAIGFRNVGLGDFIVWVIGAALLGLGWNIREPLGDFIAYFIILIQRPIKIGDYIRLEEETQGVVQRITARCVIIRRKNSTTIVIPNSQIIARSIINWNYVRNFIAFDDIDVFIDYKENADVVRDLLYQAVASHPQVLRNPKPIVRLEKFETQGYRFMVRGFISSVYTLEMWNIASDVRMNIARSLQSKNIRLALPFRVVLKDGLEDVQDIIEPEQ